MRRALKYVHTVATAALVGALALQLLIHWRYLAGLPLAAPDALGARQVMVEAARWLLVPALVVCVVSGLLLMGLNRTFASAGWVWAKAALGLLLVKGVISVNDPAVREIAALVAPGAIAANAEAMAELARLARMEWLGGWLALAITLAAMALGVWRPRLNEGAPARERAAPRSAVAACCDAAAAAGASDQPAR